MKKEKQKIYTREFKEQAIRLAKESKQPIAYTAKELGINVNTLYTWIDKYRKERRYSRYPNDSNNHEEIIRLRR